MAGFTGGRATVEEQRRIGGEADKCPIYDLYLFHFADRGRVRRRGCTTNATAESGCAATARRSWPRSSRRYLEEHQKKRESLMKDAEELLEKSRKTLDSMAR